MEKRIQTYRHGAISVSYDPNICTHAAECARGLPEVFDPREKRWIRPERAAPERIAEVVARCPSGALRFERHEREPTSGGSGPAKPDPEEAE